MVQMSLLHIWHEQSLSAAHFKALYIHALLFNRPKYERIKILTLTCIFSIKLKLSGKFYILVQALYLQSIPLHVAG